MKKFLSKDVTDAGEVVFTLGNGQKLVADPKKYPETQQVNLLAHGVKQKLGDATAGFSAKKDFAGAFAAMTEVHEALMADSWDRDRVGGIGVSMDDLVRAIAEVKKADIGKVRIAVEAAGTEKRKEWVTNKTILSKIAKYRADRLEEASKKEQVELEIDL